MATPTPATGNSGGPSFVQTAIACVLLGIIGGGGGAFLGFTSVSPNAGIQGSKSGAEADAHGGNNGKADAQEHGSDHGKGDGHSATPQNTSKEPVIAVKELPPIIVNLGGDDAHWVRLQSAIVYDAAQLTHVEKLVAEVTADITAFMRTIEVGSLEGADGLRRLQEELSERAAIRSENKVREFIIETMVVQ